MKQDILIVGGYGAVGRSVVKELIKTCPNKIVIAGRNLNKAEAFVKEIDHPLRIMKLNIYDIDQLNEAFATVHSVVMCLEATDTKFAEACIDNGVNYIDISASNEIPNQIKYLESKAIHNHVACILGVGIAPGLSTLLAKKLVDEMDQVTQLNFALMLGLGEQHGVDGVKWFLNNLRTNFEVNSVITKPFIEMFHANFFESQRPRKAYSFNLADRQIISKTLNIYNVNTYFCYDSKFMTDLIHILKRIGMLNLLKNPKIFNLFLKIFSSNTLSKSRTLTETIALHVNITGTSEGKNITSYGNIIGNNSSALTGKVIAYVAQQLYQNLYPAGVHYLNEVMNLDEIADVLEGDFSVKISFCSEI